jgi:hypothetical protein
MPPIAGTAVAMNQPQPIQPQPIQPQPMQPQLIQQQRPDPYAQPNPYGLPAVQERPYVPMQRGAGVAPVSYTPVRQTGGGTAIGSVIVGAIAFCISLVGFIPGSPVFYYSVGGVFAIVGGARVLARNGGGSRLAPIAAIVLGSLAVVFMVIGIALHVTATSSDNFTTNNAQSGSTTGSSGSGTSSAPLQIPTAPTFAADAPLSQYENTASQIAQDIDLQYGPHSAVDTPSYPVALQNDTNGNPEFPNNDVSLTAGEQYKYFASKDGKSYDVYVTGGDDKEVAVYDSQANEFTWVCDTGASANCPVGGITPGQASGTTSNS